MVQLYAGHWDAVSVVTLAPSAADPGPSAVEAALCGRPLVLNSFGATVPGCPEGWTVPGASACVPAPAGWVGPAWARAAARGGPLPTRTFSAAAVPDVSEARPVPNQHDSPVLRPADVAVYVVDAGTVAAAVAHIGAQMVETLHAIVVVGPVCDAGGTLRCARVLAIPRAGRGRLSALRLFMRVHACACVCMRVHACLRERACV